MRLTRRGFLGAIAALVAVTPVAAKATRPIAFEEIDPETVHLTYGPDRLEEVREARPDSFWGELPPFSDFDTDPDAQVDWADLEAQIELVQERVRARRRYAEGLGRMLKDQDYSVFKVDGLPSPNRINQRTFERMPAAQRAFVASAWGGPYPQPKTKVTLPRLPFAAWEKTVKP